MLVMTLVMLPTTALATEITVPDGYYQVTVKVAPTEATVKFYSDSDATTEITENVYDDGTVDGYHQYTFVAPEGTYSYRAWEGEQFLGGMEFKVPIADEYASDGTLMGKGQVLTLKRVNFVTTSTKITNTDDYTLHLYPQDLSEAVNGTSYVNENGNVVAPIMVNAAGNALTYNCSVDVNGELGKTYAVTPMQNLTFSPGTTVQTQSFSVGNVTWYTITAPAEAKVQMFKQNNNFNVSEILVNRTEKLEDGQIKSYFATPGGNTITYRVSMQDKVTRAGYASSKDMVFTFEENEDPKSTTTTALRIENSSMLNINAQNNLRLDVGDTYRLRSFRAGWQIINTDTENIMIEPDFHYNIISGAEYINLVPVTDKCTGNAGSGMNANWIDIEAVSPGTAIVEVSYDAIQIGGSTSYPGTFGAVDPSRKSVVVITVGGAKENNLKITPINGTRTGSVWDAEFDTLYFADEAPNFTFKAAIGGASPEMVEVSTDLGRTWKTVSTNADGIYEATNLSEGSNILKVTGGGDVQYQVVRASKLEVVVLNMTRGGDTIIAGDSVRVIFSGIYTPVPKMSGIYNPVYGGNPTSVVYTVPDGASASNSGTQYGFAADNQYNLKFTDAGTYTFENGYITEAAYGDAPGNHRLLTDAGRGVNFNAMDSSRSGCIMPDLTFEVIEMPTVNVSVESDPEGAVSELKDASGNIIEANAKGTYDLDYGTYSYKLTMDGYVPARGKFTVGGNDRFIGKKTVTISMKPVGGAIWDGSTLTEPQKDSDGVYLIGTGAELAWYASNHGGASARLTADISLGGFGVSINSLQGTFDGNGHYITDLCGGTLFVYPKSDSAIKNLGVEGEVTGSGGIVAHNNRANVKFTVEGCVFRGSVTGGNAVGGIVGNADMASTDGPHIINCYNAGTVTGSGYTGGISGHLNSAPFNYVKNCYNIGTTSNYGVTLSGRGTNSNNYTLLGSSPNAGGSAVMADDLKTYASILGPAYMDNPTNYNNGYPILKWEESRALEYAKEEYSLELEEYRADEYFELTEVKARAQAIEDGKAAIAAATTLDEVQAALEQAKEVIDNNPAGEKMFIPGDTNGDGTMNLRDLIKLCKYMTDDSIALDMGNTDINRDGSVTLLDLIRLCKLVSEE